MFVGIGKLANKCRVPFKLFESKDGVLYFINSIAETNPVKNKFVWDKESGKRIDTGLSSLVITDDLITVSFAGELDSNHFFDEGAYFQGDGFYSLEFKKVDFNQNFLKFWSDD